MSFSLSLLRLSLVARQAILRLQLEIAEDSADPAEIIHGFERFELWIIRGRERLADVDTEDTWGDLRTWELGAAEMQKVIKIAEIDFFAKKISTKK